MSRPCSSASWVSSPFTWDQWWLLLCTTSGELRSFTITAFLFLFLQGIQGKWGSKHLNRAVKQAHDYSVGSYWPKCVCACVLFLAVTFNLLWAYVLLGTCIERGGIGFLSITLMCACSSLCAFSRFYVLGPLSRGVWFGKVFWKSLPTRSAWRDSHITGCPGSGR